MIEGGEEVRPAPKHPKGEGWRKVTTLFLEQNSDEVGIAPMVCWSHPLSMTSVMSSTHWVTDDGDPHWEWHVSVSGHRRTGYAPPSRMGLNKALVDFGMLGADEDNHLPGVARHFWLNVGQTTQAPCDCKATEKPHDEGDGFIWREAPKK